ADSPLRVCSQLVKAPRQYEFSIRKIKIQGADGKLHKNQILVLKGTKNRPQPELCPAWGRSD
ncbi:hypothetical protein, partial [Treponema denticola]|uniref:hypothetical protein n=1 Tax=Treponema denticola TaxID=158 RepID=UPI003D8F4243